METLSTGMSLRLVAADNAELWDDLEAASSLPGRGDSTGIKA